MEAGSRRQEASRTKKQVPTRAEKVWREPAIHCVLGTVPGARCTFLKVLFQTTLSDRNYYSSSAHEETQVQKG